MKNISAAVTWKTFLTFSISNTDDVVRSDLLNVNQAVCVSNKTLSQASYWQRSSAGVQGRRRRVGAMPQRPRRVCSELLPRQRGRPSPGRRRSQNLPQRLHQGRDSLDCLKRKKKEDITQG